MAEEETQNGGVVACPSVAQDASIRQQPEPALTMSPTFLADRRLVEDFAKLVVETLGDKCLAAVCLPWTGANGNAPQGVVCPTSKEEALNMAQTEEAFQTKTYLI